MITINNTQYRNLTEQVLKNKEDIARHYEIDRVLADFGIRVLGRLDSISDLPAAAAFYGDAYAIGTETPYDYYVWTRANPDINEPIDYWLDIGSLAIPGPTGPQGEKGDTGATGASTRWYSAKTAPVSVLNYKEGDQWLSTSDGLVYQFTNDKWINTGSIRGPQGIMGPTGEKGEKGDKGDTGEPGPRGDVGGLVNIRNILPTIDLLPSPEELNNLTIAYLIGETEPYDLYIQIGTAPATASWSNTGPFNAATLITNTDGTGVNVKPLVKTIDASNPGLIESGDIFSQLRAGKAIGVKIASNQAAIPTGISFGNNYTITGAYQTACGTNNRINSAATYSHASGFENTIRHASNTLHGYALQSGNTEQSSYGRYNTGTNTTDRVVIGAGISADQPKDAIVANEQRVQVETPPTGMSAVRNIWLDPEYDVNHLYAIPIGDLYAIYNESDGKITEWYVGQSY